MKLKKIHLAKIEDDRTRKALEDADDDAKLRVILTLLASSEGPTMPKIESQAPGESRQDYRKRLIVAQTEQRQVELGGTIHQLQQQSLDVKGGTGKRITRHVVVEGEVRDILESLELPGVATIQVDRAIVP